MSDTTSDEDQQQDRAAMLAARAAEGRTIHDEDELRRRSRRSVLTGAAAIAVGGGAWYGLQTGPTDDGLPTPLRRTFAFNDALWDALPTQSSAREFPASAARPLRVNGTRGIQEDIDLDAWTMVVQDDDGTTIDELDLEPVLALDQVEMTIEHKCIEGWSTVCTFTGPRFSDFAARYDADVTGTDYVAFQTPDAGYYVGLTRERAMHPQTLLAHRLNGEALTQGHGAPLRLYTPNNYGIKSLKRIGIVQFTNTRPADFWAERGYDWHSEF